MTKYDQKLGARFLGPLGVAVLLAGATGLPVPALSSTATTASAEMQVAGRPLLGSAEQEAAEKLLLELLKEPSLIAEQARLKAYLATTDIGKSADGAARIDEVVAQWTNSLIFKELLKDRPHPIILWGTDDTPREWLGHKLGGVGTSGDNPDHIYRSTQLDGSGRYEIIGKFNPEKRPAQFVLSAAPAIEFHKQPLSKNKADLGVQIALLSDKDIPVAPDGSFRVTLGGEASGATGLNIPLPAEAVGVGFRDVLSDWDQLPAQLIIRRLDDVSTKAVDKDNLLQRIVENLDPYIRFWANYPVIWFGGLANNSVSTPVPRDGGWGYLSGSRFSLKADEAFMVTINGGGAQYVGIQVVDPWMIASDARHVQTSLNPSQAKADADGGFTFVVSPWDPGVWNWLDSNNLYDGLLVLRWQNMLRGEPTSPLLKDFKVLKRDEIKNLQGVVKINASERRDQILRRLEGYSNRTR